MTNVEQPVRVAIVDLYNGIPNEGMRAIRELLAAAADTPDAPPVEVNEFATRLEGAAPDLDHDIYISTGGPGSPFDGEGMAWEQAYFGWVDAVWEHNRRHPGSPRSVLFICHSYQMMVRHFRLASVIPRISESFGVFPVHATLAGREDPLLSDLPDPFYAADFRNWQVVKPNWEQMRELGADILAVEKARDHVPLERAIMGIRLSPHMVGVQFHPEADPPGMARHFSSDERRKAVIEAHGIEKYERIMRRLEDPAFLQRTYDSVIPGFLRRSLQALGRI